MTKIPVEETTPQEFIDKVERLEEALRALIDSPGQPFMAAETSRVILDRPFDTKR